MPRPKGTPKTGGRTKGSPTKKSIVIKDFRCRLETNKVDLEKELSKAILSKDIDMIKALTSLMPYLTARLKDAEAKPPQAPPIDDTEDDATFLQQLKNSLDSDA